MFWRLVWLVTVPHLCLAQSSATTSVSGKVVNAVTGAPLGKALLSFHPANYGLPSESGYHASTMVRTETSASGEFTIGKIDAGDCYITASRAGDAPVSVRATLGLFPDRPVPGICSSSLGKQ